MLILQENPLEFAAWLTSPLIITAHPKANVQTILFHKHDKRNDISDFKTLIVKYFCLSGRLLITDQFLSPEPLSASWSCHLLQTRRKTEDGRRCLHGEDEIDVSDHHGETRQKGEAETKATNTAAESCSNPVHKPRDTKQTHLSPETHTKIC